MDETDVEFVGDEKAKPKKRFVETPRYFLLTAQYINDTYYPQDTIIEGDGITPNEGMEPRNQAAQDAYDTWYDNLPAPPQRHEDFIAAAYAARPRHDVPLPTPAARKKPSRISGKETAPNAKIKVVADESVAQVPKKQMGTIVHEVPNLGLGG